MILNGTSPCNITKQFLYEIGAWVRQIEFFSQEIFHMKNRLSEVIDHVQDREQLALAEHYQNQFIIKDDLFDHMKHELRSHSLRCKEGKSTDLKSLAPEIVKAQNNFREQVKFMEEELMVLNRDYNTYLSNIASSRN